jgi:hypothetical protein
MAPLLKRLRDQLQSFGVRDFMAFSARASRGAAMSFASRKLRMRASSSSTDGEDRGLLADPFANGKEEIGTFTIPTGTGDGCIDPIPNSMHESMRCQPHDAGTSRALPECLDRLMSAIFAISRRVQSTSNFGTALRRTGVEGRSELGRASIIVNRGEQIGRKPRTPLKLQPALQR